MTTDPIRESLAKAIAPADEYEIPDDLPLPPEPGTEPEEPDERPRFSILNDRMATWALRKYREVVTELEEAESGIEETYAEERARIDRWKEAVLGEQPLRSARRSKEFFEAHLKRYMEHIRAVSAGKKKSLKLPSGTLASTASQRIEVDDEEAFIEWAWENGRFDLLKVEPSITGLKKRLLTDDDGALRAAIADADTGVVFDVPNIRIVPNVTYSVKPA